MNDLLSKQGQSVTQLSHLLIASEPSARLPSMQAIASKQGMSVGTVQAAMQYLQTSGIVDIENRGRLGAFVRELDYLRLWSLAYPHAMRGMISMPYSRRIEGLATGIREAFIAQSFDMNLRFMRGSTERIQRLHAHRCDWVVTSRYAAESARIQGFDVEIVFAFGTRTYTVDHVLVLNGSETLQPGMRVGIDTHSADHAYVVRLLSRGIPVTFVEIDYSMGLDQILRGEIDATVWTADDLPILPAHIFLAPLINNFAEDVYLQKLGEAVILARPDAHAVANVLRTTLDVERLQVVQQEVLDGQRRPTY